MKLVRRGLPSFAHCSLMAGLMTVAGIHERRLTARAAAADADARVRDWVDMGLV